jgi:hypothetical protein
LIGRAGIELGLPLPDALGSDLPELHATEGGPQMASEQRPVTLPGGGTQWPTLHEPVFNPVRGIAAEEALATRRAQCAFVEWRVPLPSAMASTNVNMKI